VGVKKLGSWVGYGSTARMYVSALTSQRVSTGCAVKGGFENLFLICLSLCVAVESLQKLFLVYAHICVIVTENMSTRSDIGDGKSVPEHQ